MGTEHPFDSSLAYHTKRDSEILQKVLPKEKALLKMKARNYALKIFIHYNSRKTWYNTFPSAFNECKRSNPRPSSIIVSIASF